MRPIPNHGTTSEQIFESVERALLEAISPQVLGISVVISPTKDVAITMFVWDTLPEEERRYLNVVMEEIMYGPPRVARVRINVLDHALQPLKPVGTWLFIRKGIQADRGTVPAPAALPVENPSEMPIASQELADEPYADESTRSCSFLQQSACRSTRRVRHRWTTFPSGSTPRF